MPLTVLFNHPNTPGRTSPEAMPLLLAFIQRHSPPMHLTTPNHLSTWPQLIQCTTSSHTLPHLHQCLASIHLIYLASPACVSVNLPAKRHNNTQPSYLTGHTQRGTRDHICICNKGQRPHLSGHFLLYVFLRSKTSSTGLHLLPLCVCVSLLSQPAVYLRRNCINISYWASRNRNMTSSLTIFILFHVR